MFEQVSILNQNVQYYTEEQNIQFLLTNMKTYSVKHIVDSFELRQFLLRRPKMLIEKNSKQLGVQRAQWETTICDISPTHPFWCIH